VGKRAFYSIDPGILDAFNRLVPAARRSKIVESMLAEHVGSSDGALTRAAHAIEADTSYADVMADAGDLAFAGLARLAIDGDEATGRGER
jgi:hypothetical protein